MGVGGRGGYPGCWSSSSRGDWVKSSHETVSSHTVLRCGVVPLIPHCLCDIDELPYAQCFICGVQGHLSSQCPENANGLYPSGGCCHR